MDSIQKLKLQHKKFFSIALLMILLILIVLIASLSMGAMDISIKSIINILFAKITHNTANLNLFKPNEVAVIWDIRLPRIICGLFVGGGLSVAGVIFQSLLRNPLADPYTLGVSTGAAFGSSLAILFNITYGIMFSNVTFAFVFAFLTLIAVIIISQRGGGILSSNLIISGIIVSSILSSGISFIKMIAGENVSAIVFWLMGSLVSKQWSDVYLIVPSVLVLSTISFILANDLNVITIGDKSAETLGVNIKYIRFLYLILGSSITAICVAISGVIGFIGLVIPHILRFWLTSDNRILIPLSALMGGLILSIADNLTRLISVSEIPVGLLTTLLGGPFFIYVFIKRRN